MKKALLVNISDIGDIVSSSILADSLIEQSYEVSFLIPKFVHALWETHPHLKLVTEKDVKNESFDLIVDLTSDKKSRQLVRSIKAKTKLGRIKDTWQRLRHWVTYTNMVPKKFDGHIVRDYYPLLHFLNDHQERIPQLSGKASWPELFGFNSDTRAVAIHFGAHNPKRVIPEYLLTHVIQALHERGFKIILIGTEDEIAQEIIQKNQNIPIYKKLSLADVKSVLLASKLFVGADSGILHIASALGVPAVGVYGPNVPRRSGPLHPNITIFEQNLDCRPCNQNLECPIGVKCMMTLDKDQFLAQILKKLNVQ